LNILLVYPAYPDTFWSFKHALKFVSKGASFPPLGLLTVASLLPKQWNKKLIDMNVDSLKDEDLLIADYVFISAMSVQKKSADEIILQCRRLNVPIVAGGPLFTSSSEYYEEIDHLILNEAEITLPRFIKDLEAGEASKKYSSDEWADITTTPVPLWELISTNDYSSMNIQYSRGCPFDCEFCDITVLYGHKPRTKTAQQIEKELDALYLTGWRGPLFFVDDNFIGNKVKLKKEILPVITAWMEKRNHPFYLNTEASINLADDPELLSMMVKAGFEAVFIGIESPNEASLIECHKPQNRNRDLLESVRRIQGAGLEVQGGFIVGFDNDHSKIFDDLINFIQQSGIVTAMVGLLNAPRGTKLEKRLKTEGRMESDFTGDNTDVTINFVPVMNREKLISGYKDIIRTIYSPQQFYERVMLFMKSFTPGKKKVFHLNSNYIFALFKSMLKLGVVGEERFYYWRLFFWSLFHKPQLFSLAILFTIYGYHFKKISDNMN
jgi:radical SAM superfamily enzyme YgiQ (UPF0313 family)